VSERWVEAVHGLRRHAPDPEFEGGFARWLRDTCTLDQLKELYSRFAAGDSDFDARMRRMICAASCKSLGQGVQIEPGVRFKHIETMEIGNRVFIGGGAYLQGRFDGRCFIGDSVWIGPHAYFDARDLVLEDYVGWGPGAKVLGSEHTGVPLDRPIIQTDLRIQPVFVRRGADVGTGAILLPGVTIGEGAIVGAGSVVTHDVAPFSIVAGSPARFLRMRSADEGVAS
jgi:acetyltransferase-like isoleucine patch superfamily enzyme